MAISCSWCKQAVSTRVYVTVCVIIISHEFPMFNVLYYCFAVSQQGDLFHAAADRRVVFVRSSCSRYSTSYMDNTCPQTSGTHKHTSKHLLFLQRMKDQVLEGWRRHLFYVHMGNIQRKWLFSVADSYAVAQLYQRFSIHIYTRYYPIWSYLNKWFLQTFDQSCMLCLKRSHLKCL